MQIIYDEKNVYVKITIDYCDVDAMKRLCEIITEDKDNFELWEINGINLNHALDEKDIFESQKRLNKLFSKKGKCMNITEISERFRDCISLNKKELIKYFADFSIYYMEIMVTAQNNSMDMIEFGTDSDSNYIYIKKEKSVNSVLGLLQQIGIERLDTFTCKKNDLVWNDNIFECIGEKYPEINDYFEHKIIELKKDGWTIQEKHIKNCYWKKKKRLIYHLSKAGKKDMDIEISTIQYRSSNSSFVVTFA